MSSLVPRPTFCTNNDHLAIHSRGYRSTQFPIVCAKTSEAMVIDSPNNEAGIKVVGKRTIRKRKAANSTRSRSGYKLGRN